RWERLRVRRMSDCRCCDDAERRHHSYRARPHSSPPFCMRSRNASTHIGNGSIHSSPLGFPGVQHMDLGLKGRTALVTGGSRGLGYSIAQLLAAEGCHLHLASRSAADLETARRKIMEVHDINVTCHAMDLGASENARKLAHVCFDVDILVNNAGAIPHGSIVNVDEKTWREAWDLKVFGFINLVREIYPKMCERKRGVIVNVIGVAGERPQA